MYISFNGSTIWSDDGTITNAILKEETDLNGRVRMIEELGDRQLNIYRDTKRTNRAYTVVITYGSTRRWSIPEIQKWFEDIHSANVGEASVIRKMDSGRELVLVAVAETPQWTDVGDRYATVTQVYTAALPLWRTNTETVETAEFLGTTPTTIAFDNAGDTPTFVRLAYQGPLDDPEVAYGTEWEIAFEDLSLAGDDTLEVNAKTPASVLLSVGGGAATAAYGYRTAASSFRRAKLPVGSGVLDIVQASDNPELILNPGYETAGGGGADVFANWAEVVGAGAIADDAVVFHSGAHSAKLTTAVGVAPTLAQTFVVEPGARYDYSFWARGNGAAQGRYRIRDMTNAVDIVAVTGTGVTAAAWAAKSGYFIAPAGCISVAVYCYGAATNPVDSWFDDWSVVAHGQLELGYYQWFEKAL